MTNLDDFVNGVIADVKREIPDWEQFGQTTKDIAFRSARTIGECTFRAVAGVPRPDDHALVMEARASVRNIKTAGRVKFEDAFGNAITNAIAKGLTLVKGLLGLPG